MKFNRLHLLTAFLLSLQVAIAQSNDPVLLKSGAVYPEKNIRQAVIVEITDANPIRL